MKLIKPQAQLLLDGLDAIKLSPGQTAMMTPVMNWLDGIANSPADDAQVAAPAVRPKGKPAPSGSMGKGVLVHRGTGLSTAPSALGRA